MKYLKYSLWVIVIGTLFLFLADAYSGLGQCIACNSQVRSQRYVRLAELGSSSNWSNFVHPFVQIDFPGHLEPRGYEMSTDSNGFIVTDANHESPDFNIFFLGGSTTFCAYVDKDLRFPAKACSLISLHTKAKVNSYNASIEGINSLHSINILLNKVTKHEPEMVVLHHNVNDMIALMYFKGYINNSQTRSNLITFDPNDPNGGNPEIWKLPNLRNFVNQQAPRNLTMDEFDAIRGEFDPNEVDTAEIKREFRRNMETFIGICEVRGITPVLLTQSSTFEETDDEWMYQNYDWTMPSGSREETIDDLRFFRMVFWEFNKVIRETGKRNNCLVIDLERAINGTENYYDVVHYNNQGSEKVAAVLDSTLSPLVDSLLKSQSHQTPNLSDSSSTL